MSETVIITEVKIRLTDRPEGGLVGWASCVLNNCISLDSISIYQNENGRIALSFPRKRSSNRTEYHFFKPITRAAYDLFLQAITRRLNQLKESRS